MCKPTYTPACDREQITRIEQRDMLKRKQSRNKGRKDPPVRPQLYLSVLLIMVMIVLLFTGAWDWAIAVLIGLFLGNMLSVFTKRS